MDSFDLKVSDLLGVLAKIVNLAGEKEKLPTETVDVAHVPLELLFQAKFLLKDWAETEYTSDAIRRASHRTF